MNFPDILVNEGAVIMKKMTGTLTLLLLLMLSGCKEKTQIEEPVDMNNIDQYIDSSVRFIDLRNNEDLMRDGYIAGFENIPFFEYLEGRALTRNHQWEFSSEDITNADVLRALFGSEDQVLVLVCGTGTRSGYVKQALEELGYSHVINAGGVWDYYGTNKVEGAGLTGRDRQAP